MKFDKLFADKKFQNYFKGLSYDKRNTQTYSYDNNTYLTLYKRDGDAFVPVRAIPSAWGSKNKKRRWYGGERRIDDVILYERIIFSEPMVFRSILLTGKFTVAFGYNFRYIRKYINTELSKPEKQRLDWYDNWAEFINLTQKMFQIVVSMRIYGDAFIEKVYDVDNKKNGGWGIVDLKVLYPPSVYVERSLRGNVISYWQKPPSYFGSDVKKIKEHGMELSKDVIVHFKWNDYVNLTYGTSDLKPLVDTVAMKVGMREDAAIMVQQRANPIIAWLVGDIDHPVPDKYLASASSYLSAIADGSMDVVLPGFIKPSVVSTGDKMPDINVYLNMLSSEIIKGLGVPEVLMGEGSNTTEATAKIQLESFYTDLKFNQNYISDKLRISVISDIEYPFADKPKKTRGTLRPDEFRNVPSLKFKPIMGDKDLIDKAVMLYQTGIIGISEARMMIGENSILDKDQLHPSLQSTLKSMEFIGKNIGQPGAQSGNQTGKSATGTNSPKTDTKTVNKPESTPKTKKVQNDNRNI